MTAPSFDIAIIGAGVVGCAAWRAFTLAGLSCVLIEREADIISGASKGNSAILHTGFDATPGSLEVACMREGYRLYREIHERLGLPLLETGAMVAAWSAEELEKLPGIVTQAHQNGVMDVTQMTAAQVRAREPGLADDVKGGVWIPGEALIDPWSAPLAYARQALANGGTLRLNAEVISGSFTGGAWTLNIKNDAPIQARIVINCAGNFGDLVEAIARPSPFTITPRKGQFVVYDKPAHDLVQSIILPVPTARTKGIVITRTAFGNLLVGPTAEDQPERRLATTETATLNALHAAGCRMLPALSGMEITTAYAGLRPATQFKDYQIEALPARNWITAGGIRSTGLTGALGIARHMSGLYEEHFGTLKPLPSPLWPRVPNLTEALPRPYAQPGRSEIICHCELVTRDEIAAALAGPLPAGSIGGLRRRTRCMMGRCQGFYCSRRVLELAAPHIPGLADA
ncbi:FAD/NAD(P)-binding oxidoreductase [Acidocella aquatica]|uniref:FAD/NAD(P)-binding oxidoreductase n=1 Tax=Acidocella aquatica TaxID=1922313 RepID=A0ABQ6A405_9PROT|nr:NAD(P)/FAD-dependent oxidoreductase [Acidocella aquatica]GLR66368.1 FAD/NAD(P)-binding oxidoreductase [Acidocella aquatica]